MAFPIFFRTMTSFRVSTPVSKTAPSKAAETSATPLIAPAVASHASPVVATSVTATMSTPAPGPAPTSASDSASASPASESVAASTSTASPLRSLIEHAADHAVIFISTFLFGDDAWHHDAASKQDHASTASQCAQETQATAARGRATTRMSRRSHGRRPRNVPPFSPSLPSIGEDSATIDVDEVQLQCERAAHLVRFDLRILARGSFDDDDEDDEDSDSDSDADDQVVDDRGDEGKERVELLHDVDHGADVPEEKALGEEAEEVQAEGEEPDHEDEDEHVEEQAGDEVDDHDEGVADQKKEEEQREEAKEELKNDSAILEPPYKHDNEHDCEADKAVDGDDDDDAAASAGEEDGVAGHHIAFDSLVTSEADVDVQADHVAGVHDHDELEQQVDDRSLSIVVCGTAATKIQRLVRHWMNAKTERSIRDQLEAQDTGKRMTDDDVDVVSVASTSSTSNSTTSTCASTTSVASTTASTTSTSASSSSSSTTGAKPTTKSSKIHVTVPSYTNVKAAVDSNNGSNRTRQYPISLATQMRRAAEAQRKAEIKCEKKVLEARLRAVESKVDSLRSCRESSKRTSPPL